MTGADVSFITDPGDPRLHDYRDLKDRRLDQDSGKFMAESEGVVRRLLGSALGVDSVLVTAPRLATLEPALRPGVPVYVAPQEVVDGIAGFPVHRGCLAVGRRPANAAIPADARTVVVLEDLVDVDNLGAVIRNAAALGADAVLLSPRCADPFYRKAIRVSMGSVFTLPIVRAARWPAELADLRAGRGFFVVGAVVTDRAVPLRDWQRPDRVAVLLGTEGPGLQPGTQALCDVLLTIPMATGHADSLNVATAGAVFLFHLQQS